MRQVLSLLLVSALVLPAAPVSAQRRDPGPTLADRLDNMSAEAERFLGNKPELAQSSIADSERVVTDGPFKNSATAKERDESNSEAMRKKLMGAGRGKTVTVTLNNRTVLQGRLGDVTEDFFDLLLVTDEWRQLTFDEVAKVWIEPFAITETPEESTWWSTKNTLIVLGVIVGALVLASSLAVMYKGS